MNFTGLFSVFRAGLDCAGVTTPRREKSPWAAESLSFPSWNAAETLPELPPNVLRGHMLICKPWADYNARSPRAGRCGCSIPDGICRVQSNPGTGQALNAITG